MARKSSPLPHEDRGEQPILDRAELLAHNTDEPQEGDSGKRHQTETDPDQSAPLRVGLKRLKATFGQGDAQHDHRRQEKHPEDNSRDCRRAPRSPKAGRQMRRDIGHRSSSGAAMIRISRS